MKEYNIVYCLVKGCNQSLIKSLDPDAHLWGIQRTEEHVKLTMSEIVPRIVTANTEIHRTFLTLQPIFQREEITVVLKIHKIVQESIANNLMECLVHLHLMYLSRVCVLLIELL